MYDTSPGVARGSPKVTRRERKLSLLYRRAIDAVRLLKAHRLLWLVGLAWSLYLADRLTCRRSKLMLAARAALWRHQLARAIS